jgi:AbrB family transcriptional regulator (stage V sporulation protein T)
MRATGIVRRIDDLGRIVIPKEVRRTLNIKEGDPMEIFLEDGSVIFKKYSTLQDRFLDVSNNVVKTISQKFNLPCIITNMDKILCISGVRRKSEYFDKVISNDIDEIIRRRYSYNKAELKVPIYDFDATAYKDQIIVPIIIEGDVAGSIIVFTTETEIEMPSDVFQAVENFAKFMENMCAD